MPRTKATPVEEVVTGEVSTDTTKTTPKKRKTEIEPAVVEAAADVAQETAPAAPVGQVMSLDELVGAPVSSTSAASASVVTTAPATSPAVKETPRSVTKQIPVAPLKPRMPSRPVRQFSGGPTSNVRARFSANNQGGYGSRQNDRQNDRQQDRMDRSERQTEPDAPTGTIKGILDLSRDGHGVVRESFAGGDRDAYISTSQIRRFKLRPGDLIEGPAREPKENERYWGILQVEKVNGFVAEELARTDRVKFQSLTPVYPDEQVKLETGEEPLSLRVIDMIAPIGKGQRSLVVSPPKAGKTTLLKEIATGIAANHSEMHLMAVLVGERPEEVTDIRRHIEKITKGVGETAASNFDEAPEDQCRVAELALERAKRLVEQGKDVVILLDSITRLARAYNLSIPTSGRTLSGGFDPAAIHPTKRFFGAARNFEVAGSLTIIGTALVDTGSRMDDVIFEEFKGTGNNEIILDRRLAERRIYPSIDVQRSGTRRDDLLIDPMTYQSIMTLQRMLDTLDKEERTPMMIEQLKRSKSNKEFLASLKAA
jgi:transcription termination factor Rho